MLIKYFVGNLFQSEETLFALRYSSKTGLVYISTRRRNKKLLSDFFEEFDPVPGKYLRTKSWDQLIVKDGEFIGIIKHTGHVSVLRFKILGYKFLQTIKRLEESGWSFTETKKLVGGE